MLASFTRSPDGVGLGSSQDSPEATIPPRGRLLIVVNTPEFFLSHRRAVATAARAAGWDVHVATGPGAAAARIRAAGFAHHRVPIDRGGLSPVRDLRCLFSLWRLMRRLKPGIVHAVTIKPVIWGGLAARLAQVPAQVSAISGLGWVFLAEGRRADLLRRVVALLYRAALGGPRQCIVFQNQSDRNFLAGLGIPLDGRAEIIAGSGVDLDRFSPSPEPTGMPVVLMPARLLVDKGVREFVAAAEMLASEGVAADFVAVGPTDAANPAAVPEHELERWRRSGPVVFRGNVINMPLALANSHVVVLPSYREGMPKSLLEAAAAGRAVVTTDTPGCRDAIVAGETGLLVPVGDAAALAGAIRLLLGDPARRAMMGAAGRRHAERAFDVRDVASAHLAIYEALSPGNPLAPARAPGDEAAAIDPPALAGLRT